MITAGGEALEQFTVPFNIYKLQQDVEAAQKEAEAANDKAAAEKFQTLKDGLTAATAKLKELKDHGKGSLLAEPKDDTKIEKEETTDLSDLEEEPVVQQKKATTDKSILEEAAEKLQVLKETAEALQTSKEAFESAGEKLKGVTSTQKRSAK